MFIAADWVMSLPKVRASPVTQGDGATKAPWRSSSDLSNFLCPVPYLPGLVSPDFLLFGNYDLYRRH